MESRVEGVGREEEIDEVVVVVVVEVEVIGLVLVEVEAVVGVAVVGVEGGVEEEFVFFALQ